jgi:hypothetical protein
MSTDARQLGYCTNVHAGADLTQTWDNLRRFAVSAKGRYSPDADMGVGLWLSSATAGKLLADNKVAEFARWLRAEGLVPFTLNGFPYGDFHQAVVKHLVYEPTWYEKVRLSYTLNLIEILDAILPPDLEGSISTLPIAWGAPQPDHESLQSAALNLVAVAERLRRLEDETGRLIYVCIEPEPGCVIQRSRDICEFFDRYLCAAGDATIVRRYLRVCHDICHAAVMFESQDEVVRRYREAGIAIGKVQVSSAIHLPLDALSTGDRAAALEQLAGFAEDRYLHQTVVRSEEGEVFYDDLAKALSDQPLHGELRVHFHVPIYLEGFGMLRTSRREIEQCLAALAEHSDVRHFEVETYAWGVLPAELRQPDLAAGIADELRWFASVAQ